MSSGNNITITRYTTPHHFITAVEPALSATREWQNVIPIGLYALYASPTPPQPSPGEDPGGFTLLSTHDPSAAPPGGVCLVAAKSPSHHSLGVYSAVDVEAVDLAAHVGALVEGLGLAEEEGEGGGGGWLSFSGDARLVDALAARLVSPGKTVVEEEELFGSVITKEGIIPWRKKGGGSLPDPHHGVGRVVYPRDEERHGLLADMLRAVYNEARGADMPLEYCGKMVEDMVSRGDVWAYTIGGEPVSACYLGMPTRRGKCICNVGTRAEFRRNGYAETLVGEVCWRLLAAAAEEEEKEEEEEDAGGLEYLTLFFEEGSSGARIYRRIGFGKGSGGEEIVQKNLRFE